MIVNASVSMVFFAVVLLLALGSWVSPESRWASFARRVVRLRLLFQPKLDDEALAIIRVVVGDRPSNWIDEDYRPAWLTERYHAWMALLACAWPRGWQPSAALIGKEHLDAALAEGRGVVLLTSCFAFKDLMAKVALTRAGFEPCQLAQNTHGFSNSFLSRWLLNPICLNIENRFLSERLEFSNRQTIDVKSMIKDRLRQNKLVLVAMTPIGRKLSTFPFLHGRIRIATGALSLAYDMKATVLPSFTIRQPDGRLQTIIEPALDLSLADRKDESIDLMLPHYVRRLESYVTRYPHQFQFPTSSGGGEMILLPGDSKS